MNKRFKYIVVLGLIVGLVMIAVGLHTEFASAKNDNTTYVENVFVDINGDGLVDYLVEGTVIFNEGTAENLP